MSPAQIGRD